jgi:hypothetical protein
MMNDSPKPAVSININEGMSGAIIMPVIVRFIYMPNVEGSNECSAERETHWLS